MDYAGGMPDRCAADQKRDLAFGDLAEIDTSASIRDGEQTGRDVVQDDSLQGSIALSWVVIRDKHGYALFVVSSVRPAQALRERKPLNRVSSGWRLNPRCVSVCRVSMLVLLVTIWSRGVCRR